MKARTVVQLEPDSIHLPAGRSFLIRRNAAPPENRHGLHYHDHYEAFYAVSGNLTYAVEGRRYRLEAGTLLLIAPYQLHQLLGGGKGGWERIALRFCPELPQTLSTAGCSLCLSGIRHDRLFVLDEAQRQQLLWILSSLLREETAGLYGWETAQQALLTQFFLLIHRALRQSAPPVPVADASAQLVQQVVDYLEAHLDRPVTVEQLGRRFCVDRFRLTREFTRLVGCPPHRYLMHKRLQRVEQLLRAGCPPQETAARCGFSDYTNFYRRFKDVYGMGPKAWQTALLQTRGEEQTKGGDSSWQPEPSASPPASTCSGEPTSCFTTGTTT